MSEKSNSQEESSDNGLAESSSETNDVAAQAQSTSKLIFVWY